MAANATPTRANLVSMWCRRTPASGDAGGGERRAEADAERGGRCGALGPRPAEQLRHDFGPYGASEVVALPVVAPERAHRVQLLHVLDAFGDDAEAEPAPELRDRAREHEIVFALHVGDERAVDLQQFDGQPPQQTERRVPGAEVVHCE